MKPFSQDARCCPFGTCCGIKEPAEPKTLLRVATANIEGRTQYYILLIIACDDGSSCRFVRCDLVVLLLACTALWNP